MAISKDINHKGLIIQSCYIRVEEFKGDKSNLSFVVGYYANKDSLPIHKESFICSYSLTNGNALQQGYEHLKSLPKFEGAIDC